jgi:hypothetical protein
MSKHTFSIGLLVSCLVALLAIASCGGGASSPLNDLEAASGNTADSQSLAPMPDVLVSDTLPTLHQVSAPSPGDFEQIIDPIPDWWDNVWLTLHDSLASGDNVIDTLTPTYKSSNTTVESVLSGFHVGPGGTIIPEYSDALVLSSSPDHIAYATFGFTDIPDGEEILTITAHGHGAFESHANNGLYIGLGDMADGKYRWFGPYAPDAAEYKISTFGLDTANSNGRGYLTFAVYNGDQFTLTSLEVSVGERQLFPGFNWDLVQIQPLLPPDGYFNMDLIHPEDIVVPIPLPDPPLPGM